MFYKPDIAVPFDNSKSDGGSAFVIAARPNTNSLAYESAILRAISPHIELLYMSNLSGSVIESCQIIQSQYCCQNRFAKEGKQRIKRYPEMVKQFEKKFQVDFESARLIGSLEAVHQYREEIGKGPDELFQTMVGDNDFLEMFGQTIKRIGSFYVINYDIPAIFHKHNQTTNIYVLAGKIIDHTVLFSTLNHKIYEELIRDPKTKIIDRSSHQKLAWYNQLRRTYHISNSHIKAMFDMTDYIIDAQQNRIGFYQTPLGKLLLDRGRVTEQNLADLKKDPLVRIKTASGEQLINIQVDPFTKRGSLSLMDCCNLIEAITSF